LDLLEYKINNETILTFSKISEELLIVEAGKKKVKLLNLDTFTQLKQYELINDRLFKAFEFEGLAYLTFYDEEKIMIIDPKTWDKSAPKVINSKESFQSLVMFKPGWIICGEN
jgi:hypothetical protein